MGVSSCVMLKALGRSKKPKDDESDGELQTSENAVAL